MSNDTTKATCPQKERKTSVTSPEDEHIETPVRSNRPRVGGFGAENPSSACRDRDLSQSSRLQESINRYVKWDPAQWKYSPGVLAQLLVIAVFIQANKKIALSRIHQVYAGMDLEMLAGEPVEPAELSDDLFAAMLDRLWMAGCENFLSTIALTVRIVFDLPPNYVLHSDTTYHVLYGDYDSSEDASGPSLVLPTYGYSKDKRNDLKQIMTGMVTDGDGLICISHVLDGNTAEDSYLPSLRMQY